jgi:hypothetical protein
MCASMDMRHLTVWILLDVRKPSGSFSGGGGWEQFEMDSMGLYASASRENGLCRPTVALLGSRLASHSHLALNFRNSDTRATSRWYFGKS